MTSRFKPLCARALYWQVRNIITQKNLPIENLISRQGPLTMFVPADEAFGEDRIPVEQRSRLLDTGRFSRTQATVVNDQLRYHLGQ